MTLPVLLRLDRMMKRIQETTTTLISRRLDAEVGQGVGDSYTVQTTKLNPSRFPAAVEAVVAKLKKTATARPTKTSRADTRPRRPPTTTLECQYCGDKVTNFRAHNNNCRARPTGAVKKKKIK